MLSEMLKELLEKSFLLLLRPFVVCHSSTLKLKKDSKRTQKGLNNLSHKLRSVGGDIWIDILVTSVPVFRIARALCGH